MVLERVWRQKWGQVRVGLARSFNLSSNGAAPVRSDSELLVGKNNLEILRGRSNFTSTSATLSRKKVLFFSGFI